MTDKKELAATVLEKVGGAENVLVATHCITRLRFNLKDDSKADLDALKKLDGALGAQIKDGQWQVIIGAGVEAVYNELEPLLGDKMAGEVAADPGQSDSAGGARHASLTSLPVSFPRSFRRWWPAVSSRAF